MQRKYGASQWAKFHFSTVLRSLLLRCLTAENFTPFATLVHVHDGTLTVLDVINNVVGGQSLLITIMAQLTATTLVVVEVCLSHVRLTSGYVYVTRIIACSLCDS